MRTIILAVVLSCLCSVGLAGAGKPSALPRSTPEKQGIPSAAILEFVEAADQLDTMNSFMLVRHGNVVAEAWWSPYSADARHMLYSLSKSFTSTAIGLAVAEGKLSLDDPVLKFFPEDSPSEPGANLKSMCLRDLLRMATGHQTEPATRGNEPWTKIFLSHAVPHKPGTHFLYNTPATYMLSAAVQKATGTTVLDYLRLSFAKTSTDRHLWRACGCATPIFSCRARGHLRGASLLIGALGQRLPPAFPEGLNDVMGGRGRDR